MTSLVARCLLVSGAVLVAGAAVALPLTGWSRAALLAAATWCAVLDVALVRARRRAPAVVAVTPPLTPIGPVDPVPAATPDGSRIVVGTGSDGDPLVVAGDCSIVVVGSGSLATSVFCAVATQVRAGARTRGRPVRVASAPDLRATVAEGHEHCPVLPDGHAALAVPTASAHGHPPSTTVVLAAGPGTVPRRWDVAVEVSRSGCAVRYADDTRVSSVSPVLPQLSDGS